MPYRNNIYLHDGDAPLLQGAPPLCGDLGSDVCRLLYRVAQSAIRENAVLRRRPLYRFMLWGKHGLGHNVLLRVGVQVDLDQHQETVSAVIFAAHKTLYKC